MWLSEGSVYLELTEALDHDAYMLQHVFSMQEIRRLPQGRAGNYLIRYVPKGTRGHRNWELEHRLIMEAQVGRRLLRTEVVHHINENPHDNRLVNLKLMALQDHARHHVPKRGRDVPCTVCGRSYYQSPAAERRGRKTCSTRCAVQLPSRISSAQENLTGRPVTQESIDLSARIVRARSQGKTWTEIVVMTGLKIGACRDRYDRSMRLGKHRREVTDGRRSAPRLRLLGE